MYKLELEKWNRREVFDFFSSVSDPFYMVSFRQDITNLYRFVKKNNLSFYYSLVYLVTQAINSVEEFRLVIRDSDIVVIDGRIPSFTDIHTGSEVFHVVTVPLEKDIFQFCLTAAQKSQGQDYFIDFSNETDELLYLSCVPSIDITGCTNEMDVLSSRYKDDSIPRITWGKFVEQDGKLQLGISMQVNHRLIDGIHIGKFAGNLTDLINSLPL